MGDTTTQTGTAGVQPTPYVPPTDTAKDPGTSVPGYAEVPNASVPYQGNGDHLPQFFIGIGLALILVGSFVWWKIKTRK